MRHTAEKHTQQGTHGGQGGTRRKTHAQTLTLAEHLHNARKAVFANFNKYLTKKTFEKSMERGGRKWWLGYFGGGGARAELQTLLINTYNS